MNFEQLIELGKQELANKVLELEKFFSELEKTVQDHAATIAEHIEIIAQKDVEINDHSETIGFQKELISELSEANRKLPEAMIASNPNEVSFEGKTYAIQIPKFQFKGQIKTVDDIKSDPSLLETLVKSGSGVLKIKA